MINEPSLKGKVRANKFGCLDACEQGPVLVVYVSGHWYLDIEMKDFKPTFNNSVMSNKSFLELVGTFDKPESR